MFDNFPYFCLCLPTFYFEGSCSNGTETRYGNLVACGPWRVTRSYSGLHDLKDLRKRIVERMIGRSGQGVVSAWPCFRVDCGE